MGIGGGELERARTYLRQTHGTGTIVDESCERPDQSRAAAFAALEFVTVPAPFTMPRLTATPSISKALQRQPNSRYRCPQSRWPGGGLGFRSLHRGDRAAVGAIIAGVIRRFISRWYWRGDITDRSDYRMG
jgi:hypothetical protein